MRTFCTLEFETRSACADLYGSIKFKLNFTQLLIEHNFLPFTQPLFIQKRKCRYNKSEQKWLEFLVDFNQRRRRRVDF